MNNKQIVISAAICLMLSYIAYNSWQDERTANKRVTELSNQITQLEQQAMISNQIIANNELAKRELENHSLAIQEQINELLKNNDCAGQLVPDGIANRLYQRAKSLRQSADTREPFN